jgi:hypothetical protein
MLKWRYDLEQAMNLIKKRPSTMTLEATTSKSLRQRPPLLPNPTSALHKDDRLDKEIKINNLKRPLTETSEASTSKSSRQCHPLLPNPTSALHKDDRLDKGIKPSTMTIEASRSKSSRPCPTLAPTPPVIRNEMDRFVVSKSPEPLRKKSASPQVLQINHRLNFDFIKHLEPNEDMIEYVKKLSQYYAYAVDERYLDFFFILN